MTTTTDETESIQEFVDSRGVEMRVERHAGVLRGVKLLGVASRNGRRYPDAALRRAAPLYEGAKVNVNHPKGDPLTPRDYQDRIGVLREVAFRAGEGLFGVLHFNPHHPLAEQLIWDADHAPENVGLSHNVLAKTSRDEQGVLVEEITKVQSVDLVADPATTRGLFEHRFAEEQELEAEDDPSPGLQGLTLARLSRERPDLVAAVVEPLREELQACRRTIDTYQLREQADLRRRRIHQSLLEHGLPAPVDGDARSERLVSQEFLRMLLEAASDEEVDRLVSDRAAALAEARQWRPPSPAVCREQAPVDRAASARVADATDFVTAITSR